MPHLYASPHYDRSTLVQSLQAPTVEQLLDAALDAARDAGREAANPGRRAFQEQADRKAAAARDAVITALGLQARRATTLGEFLAAPHCDLAP